MDKKRWLLAAMLGLALVAGGVGVGIAANRDDDTRTEAPMADEAEDAAQGEEATENEADEATENEDEDAAEDAAEGEDTAIQDGSALERASEAALAWLAEQGLEGEVTDTEQGDEESYYEIEVTLTEGRQVDVQLDEEFNVVGLD